MNDIKRVLEKIEMSEEITERVIKNCKREVRMKKRIKKSFIIAAAVIACFGATSFAAANSGFFKDVTRWDGAIVSTTYENATEEIKVEAEEKNGNIYIYVEAEKKAPYIYGEEISITDYTLKDSDGNNIDYNEELKSVMEECKASFVIETESVKSNIDKIIIEEFTTTKKADQPLPIKGRWECEVKAE